MRAVIDATGYSKALEPLVQHRPTSLLKIADRPILFYIIENLVQAGVSKFDILLHHLPEMVEERLKKGTRWGISVTYHLTKETDQSFEIMTPIIQSWEEKHLIWGNGNTLPFIEKKMLNQPKKTVFMYSENEWSGWGLYPTDSLNQEHAEKVLTKPHFSVNSFKELLQSNQQLLKEPDTPHLFLTTAKKVEPGVWISRAVSIHPSVKIIPPIFIGENCEIKQGVQLGPNSIIENHCIIDNDSIIQDSIVCQRSYVGEALEVKNCIIDRNLLINFDLNSHINIRDDFILSHTTAQKIPFALLERLIGCVSLIIFSPLFFYYWITQGLSASEKIALPSSDNFKTFSQYHFHEGVFKRLPAFINVIKGEIHLVGVQPRSSEELKQLPVDWKGLYLKSKVGLINLSALNHSKDTTEDDIYASEAYYAVHMGWWFDLKLFLLWFKRKLSW